MLAAWSQFSDKHAPEHDKSLRTGNGQKPCESQHKKALGSEAADNDVPPNEIIQITRHKNINSFNNYSMLPYFPDTPISGHLSFAILYFVVKAKQTRTIRSKDLLTSLLAFVLFVSKLRSF